MSDYILSLSDAEMRSMYRGLCELKENYGLNDSEVLLQERLRRLIYEVS